MGFAILVGVAILAVIVYLGALCDWRIHELSLSDARCEAAEREAAKQRENTSSGVDDDEPIEASVVA